MHRNVIVVGVAAILMWTSIARADQAPPRLTITAAAVESVVLATVKAERNTAAMAMAQAGAPPAPSWMSRNWKWFVPVVVGVAVVAIVAASGGYSSDDPDY